jgi:hypothetical protein
MKDVLQQGLYRQQELYRRSRLICMSCMRQPSHSLFLFETLRCILEQFDGLVPTLSPGLGPCLNFIQARHEHCPGGEASN